jgi:hypothetical protein
MQAITNTSVQEMQSLYFALRIKALAVEVCDATGDARKNKSWALKKMLLFITVIFLSVNTIAQHSFTITFKNVVRNKTLSGDSIYINQFGETFSVRNFKYYVSNIVLHDLKNNKTQRFNEYFLINERDDTSKTIVLFTTLQQIDSFDFLLGVDSVKNVSGVQTGSLDPANGMFWTWNTGYVMAKLEGTSAAAKTPAHAFSYHIGGYKKDEDASRKISLAVAGENKIVIVADILKWFSGAHDIKIAEISFCHEPGKLAMQFADNYANMFSVGIVK